MSSTITLATVFSSVMFVNMVYAKKKKVRYGPSSQVSLQMSGWNSIVNWNNVNAVRARVPKYSLYASFWKVSSSSQQAFPTTFVMNIAQMKMVMASSRRPQTIAFIALVIPATKSISSFRKRKSLNTRRMRTSLIRRSNLNSVANRTSVSSPSMGISQESTIPMATNTKSKMFQMSNGQLEPSARILNSISTRKTVLKRESEINQIA
mmetsp:Transcript_110502/g.191569  ORF Transcript_110502/g.191569 Transcript_110502/m.191569 type:complete len:207 (-) Transcript_110502:176-796(-)